MHDVVIVGARCAGSPLAMLLAQRGHDVVLVDRANFPSDTMSTHFIQQPGIARLVRWGLADELFATGCPPITSAYFDIGEEVMELDIPLPPQIRGLASPRRHVLDKFLVDKAVSAGAELMEGATVERVAKHGDRVTGIEGRGPDGPFALEARVVVGADGRHSVVAEQVGADFERRVEPLSAGYYTYMNDTGLMDKTATFFRDDFVSVMFPTHDEATCVAIAWRHDLFKEIRRDLDGNFRRDLAGLGEIGERVSRCEATERYVGTADVPNFARRAWGPGWLLAGDARYHKDPIPADGISDAFRDAEFAADAIDAVVTGTSSEDEAFGEYGRRVTEYVDKHFDLVVKAANFEVTPQESAGAFLEARMVDAQEVMQYLAG